MHHLIANKQPGCFSEIRPGRQ